MIKEAKEIEYEDAPSGFVNFYNYKEPLMPFQNGFGYNGCLLFDGTTEKIQCHLCGEWFESLGNHINREHGMRAKEYKELVGLNKTTALINEKFRAKLIASGQERFNNLKINKGHSVKTRKKISASRSECRPEVQNITNTCPAQLLERLNKLSEELGRCPTRRETPFVKTLIKVYGSFSNACKLINLEPLKQGGNGNPSLKEELLESIKLFKESNNRNPSQSDCRRGLLPNIGKFNYHFGSLKKAIIELDKQNG